MARAIKGAHVHTTLNGQPVSVHFRSPYRWRVYDTDGNDITKAMGYATRGDSIDRTSPAWGDFHSEVEANEICRTVTLTFR